MTLRTDLAALLAEAEISDVDIEEAVKDDHARSHTYSRIIAAVTASQPRSNDRTIMATILRDPNEFASKTAFVQLVDNIAAKTANPIEFQKWATDLSPEIDLLTLEAHRDFLHHRIKDWTIYLTIKAGQTPPSAKLASATSWMQRLLAEESTSPPILSWLAENGRTRKIRNIAANRARSSAQDRSEQ